MFLQWGFSSAPSPTPCLKVAHQKKTRSTEYMLPDWAPRTTFMHRHTVAK